MIEFSHAYKPATKEDIAAFERANGIKLPASYASFLMRSNGGRPEPNHVMDVPGWKFNDTVVSFFFGLNTGDTYDLQKNVKRYKYRMPTDLMPIGDDAGGSILAVQMAGPDAGKIFYWDHENEQEDQESRANVYLVANNIDDLLVKLRP